MTRVVRLARGARLVDGRDVVSEIRDRPGPTHALTDVLAACMVALARGPRLAMLGFAGGGILAPLRAMGCRDPLHAVDLTRDGQALFRRHCARWAGSVHLAQDEAARWLRRRRTPFDLVLDDLAVPGRAGMTKPPVSFDVLPRLARQRLSATGVLISSLLPVDGLSWRELQARTAAPWARYLLIQPLDYENRVLIVGRRLPLARRASGRIRAHLAAIGSRQASRIKIRSC